MVRHEACLTGDAPVKEVYKVTRSYDYGVIWMSLEESLEERRLALETE